MWVQTPPPTHPLHKVIIMASSRVMIERQCENCGEQFLTSERNISRGWGRYCSHSCSSQHIGSKNLGMSSTSQCRRARKIWIARHGTMPICWCGKLGDIHHIDGDRTNNAEENHEVLCRSHHVSLENRLHPRRVAKTK